MFVSDFVKMIMYSGHVTANLAQDHKIQVNSAKAIIFTISTSLKSKQIWHWD